MMKMMKLKNLKVVKNAEPMQSRSTNRSEAQHSPVKEVQLSLYEKSNLYDRMYEARVWKDGRLFGYRSTKAEYWHDSEQARREAHRPVNKERIIELLTGQSKPINRLKAGELKRQHRYCLSDHLYKQTYGEDKP